MFHTSKAQFKLFSKNIVQMTDLITQSQTNINKCDNKKILIKNLLIICLIFSIFIFIPSCNEEENEPGLQQPVTDITGTWDIEETIHENCGEESSTEYNNYQVIITQNENSISITLISTSQTYTGSISGSTLTWHGTRPDDDGTISFNFTGTVSDDGNSMTGTAPWTWTDGSYTCSGSTDVSATRITQSPNIDVTGSWVGNWHSSNYGLSGTFTADIEQSDSTLSGLIEIPDIGIYNSDLTGTFNGTVISFGDVEGRITFTGVVNEPSSSYGTYIYASLSDSGTWDAVKRNTGTLSVVNSFKPKDYSCLEGLTFDGNYLWFTDGYDYTINRVDTSGNLIDYFSISENIPKGLTFDGTYLWYADWGEEKIYKLDTSGNIITSFNSPTDHSTGLAFDGEFIWIADMHNGKIYRIDTTGAVVLSFETSFSMLTGLTYDGVYLWIIDNSWFGKDKIYKIDIAGDIIAVYDSPSEDISDLAFDGEYLWSTDWMEEKIYQLRIE